MGLTFVDMAGFDPGSEVDVFSKEEHFDLDYSLSGRGRMGISGLHRQSI